MTTKMNQSKDYSIMQDEDDPEIELLVQQELARYPAISDYTLLSDSDVVKPPSLTISNAELEVCIPLYFYAVTPTNL